MKGTDTEIERMLTACDIYVELKQLVDRHRWKLDPATAKALRAALLAADQEASRLAKLS